MSGSFAPPAVSSGSAGASYAVSTGGAYSIPSDAVFLNRTALSNSEMSVWTLPTGTLGQRILIKDSAPLQWLSPLRVQKPTGGSLQDWGSSADLGFVDITFSTGLVQFVCLAPGSWTLLINDIATDQRVFSERVTYQSPMDTGNAVLSGSGVLMQNINVPGRCGVVELRVVSAGGACTIHHRTGQVGGSNNQNTLGLNTTSTLIRSTIFSLPILSNSTERFSVRFGLGNSSFIGTLPNSYIFAAYSDNLFNGNLAFESRNNLGTIFQVDSGIPLVAGQYYHVIKTSINGTVTFYARATNTNDELVTVNSWTSIAHTESTRIPYGVGLGKVLSIIKNVGNTTRSLLIDTDETYLLNPAW